MKKNIYIVCCLFFLFSCQQRKGISDMESIDMVVNIDSLSQEKLDVRTLKFIPLETVDESLIRNITKLLYVGNRYYIFDGISYRVIVFSNDGKFLYSIDNVGKGPGEYIQPIDMDIAPNGDIYVADNATQKIIRYYNDGTQFEEIKVGRYFMSFLLLNNSDLLLADIRNKGLLDIALAKYAVKTDNFSIIETYQHAMRRMVMRYTPHLFFRSETTSYYYVRFTPFLYEIDIEGNMRRIKLITEKLPTEEKLTEWENSKSHSFSADGFLCDVASCYEIDDHILLVTVSDFPSYTFVDKRNHKVYNFQSLGKNLNGYSGIKGVADSLFISYCQPSQKNLQRILSRTDLQDEDREQIMNLNQDANPILMLFNFEIQ